MGHESLFHSSAKYSFVPFNEKNKSGDYYYSASCSDLENVNLKSLQAILLKLASRQL